MDKTEYLNVKLTKQEIQNLLESLLYSSSVDVCGHFDYEKTNNFFNIAKNIRHQHPNILTEDLEIINTHLSEFEDKVTDDIIKTFPEIYLVEDIEV